MLVRTLQSRHCICHSSANCNGASGRGFSPPPLITQQICSGYELFTFPIAACRPPSNETCSYKLWKLSGLSTQLGLFVFGGLGPLRR